DFDVDDANGLRVEEFGEGPAGVVVRRALRIVGAPVLIVEQRIGNAAVRLIHADDIRTGRERARRRLIPPLTPFLPVLPFSPVLAIRTARARVLSVTPLLPIPPVCRRRRSGVRALSRHGDGERRGRARNLDALLL